jgi:hypothetical protein
MDQELLNTLQAHFHARFLRARTNFNQYISGENKTVGDIDIVEQSIKYLEEMEHSRACVELLNEIVRVNSPQQAAEPRKEETT